MGLHLSQQLAIHDFLNEKSRSLSENVVIQFFENCPRVNLYVPNVILNFALTLTIGIFLIIAHAYIKLHVLANHGTAVPSQNNRLPICTNIRARQRVPLPSIKQLLNLRFIMPRFFRLHTLKVLQSALFRRVLHRLKLPLIIIIDLLCVVNLYILIHLRPKSKLLVRTLVCLLPQHVK